MFYLCLRFPLPRCFTSLRPDHLPSQHVHQEKAVGSCCCFKQSSAGGLARGEVQVRQLLETAGADKWKLSFSLTPRKKHPHYGFCTLYYQFKAWDWQLYVQLLRRERGSSGLSDMSLAVPSGGVVGKRKERQDEQLDPPPESSQLFLVWAF